MIDRVDTEQRQSEIGEVLQQAKQLGLISNDAYEHCVPMVADHGHTLEQGSKFVSQLAFGFEPIHLGVHRPDFCTRR